MPHVPLSVEWTGDVLVLLDQTRLPAEETWLRCNDVEAVFEAIRRLAVRGAPAIGITAAWGMLLVDPERPIRPQVAHNGTRLRSARPTAVNLAWAIDRVLARMRRETAEGPTLLANLRSEALAIHDEDRAACRAIGEHGASLVAAHPRVLTHCNAGALAVSELGTALAPVYVAHERGINVSVWADETRPLMQGARLTAWELSRAGIDVTVITDSMAATVMAAGKVDMVLVGADRVAANGDVANKIGTLSLAILARHFGIPFYVACPTSTIDPGTEDGKCIPIEERGSEEVTMFHGHSVAPDGVAAFNPAFDVTPAHLVTGVITENGVISNPGEIGAGRVVT